MKLWLLLMVGVIIMASSFALLEMALVYLEQVENAILLP